MNPANDRPRVVIIGGGFAGLRAARALRRAPVSVVLVDKSNHHLFQPLLYQVATAGLNPGEIAAPIRHILSRQKNTEVALAAQRIDLESSHVVLDHRSIPFDYLVLATGAQTSYFGHTQWEADAPGLKTIDDALEIRRRFLIAFEAAERAQDPDARRAELTFVVVGGGPTGVELAGTMAELARRAFLKDFRRIDPTTARVILVEGGPRLLPAFDERLSRRAREDLERLGVQVWLDTMVTGIDDAGVSIGDERIVCRNAFWAAGIRGTPIAESLGIELSRDKRVPVAPDLSVEGHPNVFVVGDLAKVTDTRGNEVPGVAPAAMQMGDFVGSLIAREVKSGSGPGDRPRFKYRDKGMLATIGRARAVGEVFNMRLTGFTAWFMWLAVHVFFLIGFRNRVIVMIQWAWAYFTFERGARLITGLEEHLERTGRPVYDASESPRPEPSPEPAGRA